MERKTVFLVYIQGWEDNHKYPNKWGGLFSTKEAAEERKEVLNREYYGAFRVSEMLLDYYTGDNLNRGPDTI